MKIMPDRKKSGFAAAAGVLTLIVVVAGLAAGVIGLQSSKLLGSKASSGCTIVQTDQGPGCWCSNGGWQFHCGVPKGEPAPDQCISDCQDRNTDNAGDNTPKADKCDKGKVGGPCSGQYQYACGGDGCKAECNNYPKHGRWVLTGDKNCGKPGDIRPTPSSTGISTPTPTRRATNCSINVTFSNPSVVCGADSITSTHKANVTWNGNSCSSRNVALHLNRPPGGGFMIFHYLMAQGHENMFIPEKKSKQLQHIIVDDATTYAWER